MLGARRADRIKSLADELTRRGGKALAVPTDVIHSEQVKKLVDRAVQAHGRIDVMINNAGLMPQSPLERLRIDEWDRMIDVNIKGVLYGIAAALPYMKQQKSGHIMTLTPTHDEQTWFNIFRVGIWPNYFPGVQFSRDPEALNQYFRQMTPDTGPFDASVISDAVSALFNKIGPGILVTHSQGGGPGWLTAIKNRNVRAVVSYEPGSGFIFPEGEVPPAMPSSGGTLEAAGVPLSDFMLLTKIPIVIYYGDNIPGQPMANPSQDQWRTRLAMARLWADAVNRRGGDVTVVHLPEIGIRGNTHFLFSDLNNLEIADVLSKFLENKGLD